MTDVYASGIPTLQTERLKLRPFTMADAKTVQQLAGNIKVAQMTATIPHPYEDGVAEKWISTHQERFKEGDIVTWAIEESNSGSLIGCISFANYKTHQKSEAGYWIGEEYWGQGYCTEALIAGIDFAFNELNLNKITSRHLATNPASGKVMQKAGMSQEGYFKQDMFRQGQFCDMIVYGLTRLDWKS